MFLSAVIVSRNDNYGGHLNERATYCLNTMLDTFDEVVYVDWNSPGGRPLTDNLKITTNPERLKVIVISPETAKELLGERYETAQKCCEALGRNIGIRRATGDVIVSTNIDIIPPRRIYVEDAAKGMKQGDMITIAKHDITIDTLQKMNGEYCQIRDELPKIFGLNSLGKRLIIPVAFMNSELIKQVGDIPLNKLHAAAVIEACGDFQIAHKETWYNIKGFEEDAFKRLFGDGYVQYKVVVNGGTVHATNFPPVYHIDHERNNSSEFLNKIVLPDISTNTDDWGFASKEFLIR